MAATDNLIAAALVWCIGNPDALTGWSLMALSIYTLAVIAYSPLMRAEMYGRHSQSRQNATERPERPQGGVAARNGPSHTPETRTPHGASTGPSA